MLVPVFVNQQTGDKTTCRSERDEEKEPPVPPAIEYVWDYDDKQILQLQVLVENEPVEQKHYRQEYRVFYGIEKHLESDHSETRKRVYLFFDIT